MAHKKEGYNVNVKKEILKRSAMKVGGAKSAPKKQTGTPGEMLGKVAMRNKK